MDIEHDINKNIEAIDQLEDINNKPYDHLKILQKLPPQIHDPIDERLIAQLEGYLGIIKVKKGNNLNQSLRSKKEFNTIDVLYQQMNNFDIDEYGSCYAKDVFDPKGYETSEYYDALARRQSEQQASLMRNIIKPPPPTTERMRKSGWDTVSDPISHDANRFNPFLAMVTMPSLNPFGGLNPLSLIAAQNKAFVEKKTQKSEQQTIHNAYGIHICYGHHKQ